MTAPAADLTPEEREAIQRRVLRVLTGGQVVGAAALASAVTVGAFVVQGILGETTTWAGIATATVTTGTAVMSQVLSRLMRRRGRRPGLQLGYGMAVVGGLTAALGAQQRWLPVFLLGLFIYGNGQASNLLARYTAADLALPDERSRAISRIVFASTFGAVFGPLGIGPTEWVAEHWLGLWKYTGPFLFASVFFFFAMVNIALRLRPDPLVLAGGVTPSGDGAPKLPPIRASLGVIAGLPKARLAVLAMMVSQASMVAVMAMTPVHMKLHGHESVSQYVVSTHIAGMYALSPLVGRFADRKGRIPAILVGGATLIAATVLAAFAGDVEQLLFPALWLLGFGWNFGLIGGSSLLTESVPAAERVAVQGSADLLMSFCGGIAGFSSGFIRAALGYHMLANLGTLAAGMLVVVAYGYLQSARRQAGAEPAPAAGG
ncbi:MAG: MFS transporter [Acidimicrobiales bacterium]